MFMKRQYKGLFSMDVKKNAPTPLFDKLNSSDFAASKNLIYSDDYDISARFLNSYNGSVGTFNAYRREVERLIQWSWFVQKMSIKDIKKYDIEIYLEFCKSPPESWIGIKKAPRFIEQDAIRIPNPEWRPFVVTISKFLYKKGEKPSIKNYQLSSSAIKDIFSILSTFYNFLIGENFTELNPIQQIRQKSKYIPKRQNKIRRLSTLQWEYLIETAELMAIEDPYKNERTLFIITILYSLYLRVSELAATSRWTPQMNSFYKDQNNLWWFATIGKGNKERQISVSDSLLKSLKRYRIFLGLSDMPSVADSTPLFSKLIGKGPITSTTYLRKIVQSCFDAAIERLTNDGFKEDADAMQEATVHWLRHTGISDDVKIRPREHVRDDAGHSSSAITDKYIDIELRERHASAKKKLLKQDE